MRQTRPIFTARSLPRSISRRIVSSLTPIICAAWLLDGDVVFSAAMGDKELTDQVYGLAELGMIAANVMARAIARAVYEATALPVPGALPSWKDKFGT